MPRPIHNYVPLRRKKKPTHKNKNTEKERRRNEKKTSLHTHTSVSDIPARGPRRRCRCPSGGRCPAALWSGRGGWGTRRAPCPHRSHDTRSYRLQRGRAEETRGKEEDEDDVGRSFCLTNITPHPLPLMLSFLGPRTGAELHHYNPYTQILPRTLERYVQVVFEFSQENQCASWPDLTRDRLSERLNQSRDRLSERLTLPPARYSPSQVQPCRMRPTIREVHWPHLVGVVKDFTTN